MACFSQALRPDLRGFGLFGAVNDLLEVMKEPYTLIWGRGSAPAAAGPARKARVVVAVADVGSGLPIVPAYAASEEPQRPQGWCG